MTRKCAHCDLVREMCASARGKCLCGAEIGKLAAPVQCECFVFSDVFTSSRANYRGGKRGRLPLFTSQFFFVNALSRKTSRSFEAANLLNFPFENEKKYSICTELTIRIINWSVSVSLSPTYKLFKLNNTICANPMRRERNF